MVVASITVDDQTTYYDTFAEAIEAAEAYAAEHDGAYPQIEVLDDSATLDNSDWKIADGYLVKKVYVAQVVRGGEVVSKYESLAEAVAAADTGDTISVLKADTYTLPNLPKNVTVEGAVDGVAFSHTSAGNICAIPNGATFKNVSFNFGNVDYHGFQHAGPITMEGCTLNGKLFSYGDMTFTGCTFNQDRKSVV